MPTQILPTASLRSADRLPAARTPSWVVNYLICMASWSIGRAMFRAVLNFLPALRERRALVTEALRSPNSEGFRDQRQRSRFFPVIIGNNSGPAAADRTSGGRRERATPMKQRLRVYSAACGLLVAPLLAGTAFAQKPGGILQMPDFASPASMSIHEESTIAAVIPTMGVFNNLVVFDQRVPQNSLASILPELATGWAGTEDGTQLTFSLRQGVKWHDGKRSTAQDG